MVGKKRKGQIWSTLIPWIIVVAILILLVALILLLRWKGISAIEYLKNILRFGK
ncbi:MAG: hypothetical protein N3D20_01445 [Candidatus Pacearchaeota archaeon]|nr:hypothetical protein [Candidatus Pacearchaeota archaeon]